MKRIVSILLIFSILILPVYSQESEDTLENEAASEEREETQFPDSDASEEDSQTEEAAESEEDDDAEREGEEDTEPVPYTDDEFPLWLQDLRRAEIIAIGAFPMAMIYSGLGFGLYWYFTEDLNSVFLPWTDEPTEETVQDWEDRQITIILTSIGISVSVAVFDYILGIITENEPQNN
ncbi:MAG: hypothetical protein ACLFR1_16120 [Spirochaetia bacterium]